MKITLPNTFFKRNTFENYDTFVNGLRELYKKVLLPLENAYSFHYFHSPPMQDVDFEAKPVIMLVGQYSTGKTTFIKHLMKSDFPGMRIGPEPTTDKFISLMYGSNTKVIPGNALVVDPTKQYRPLSKFGNNFLNKFQCSQVNCDVLRDLTIIDTPGILSGEKQRVDRGYDFIGVLKWFAERVDRLILLFDAHKLDISDEFRRSIEALEGHDDKIRIILNKSDMIDQQQLMRVYGALMWSLGKIINTPEVTRVHIGSFWDQPLRFNDCKRLFEIEQQELLNDLMDLPKYSAIRKLNDFIKRVRLAKGHAYIIGTLNDKMPVIFGKAEKKGQLIASLGSLYIEIQDKYNIPSGDLPSCFKMQEQLVTFDFSKICKINNRMINSVNEMLENDISKLMALISDESSPPVEAVTGGMFDSLKEGSPFGYLGSEGVNAGFGEDDWIVNKNREKYDAVFNALRADSDRISGRIAKIEMIKSQLPNSVLGEIWKLADVDKDGAFDCDEFALALYLIDIKLNGYDLPANLPEHLIPPSKRFLLKENLKFST